MLFVFLCGFKHTSAQGGWGVESQRSGVMGSHGMPDRALGTKLRPSPEWLLPKLRRQPSVQPQGCDLHFGLLSLHNYQVTFLVLLGHWIHDTFLLEPVLRHSYCFEQRALGALGKRFTPK